MSLARGAKQAARLAGRGMLAGAAWLLENSHFEVGPKQRGYMWEDSDGDRGIEIGRPPADGSHPRKPGSWNAI